MTEKINLVRSSDNWKEVGRSAAGNQVGVCTLERDMKIEPALFSGI
jgi:hypothetical protein